ncbi:hypothetical protein V8C35DRAFT_302771 [Trichoderma chlorosporum]
MSKLARMWLFAYVFLQTSKVRAFGLHLGAEMADLSTTFLWEFTNDSSELVGRFSVCLKPNSTM